MVSGFPGKLHFLGFLEQILCYSANTMRELLTELELECVIKAPSIYTSCLHRQEYDLMKAVRVPTSNIHSKPMLRMVPEILPEIIFGGLSMFLYLL